MAKEVWKIDKFEGGLNGFTDSKDLAEDEFAELQDCSVAKIGQLNNLGKPIISTAIPSVQIISGVDIDGDDDLDTNLGLIPGAGFFRFPNDYALGTTSTAQSAVITSDETIKATDGTQASCEFEIVNMMWVFSDYNDNVSGQGGTEGSLTFRLTSYNGTTEDTLPSSNGFDIGSAGWEVIDIPNPYTANNWLDNYTFTFEGNTFSAENAHKSWSVDQPLSGFHELQPGNLNELVLGGARYKAVGFYRYSPVHVADTQVGASITMPATSHEAGVVRVDLNYQLIRQSFIDKLVANINGIITTPNVTASSGEFGRGTIKLTAADKGTILNGYRIFGVPIASSITSGTAVTTPDVLVSNASTSTDKSSGGVCTTMGNNVFSGGVGPTQNTWKIKCEGPPVNNDRIYVSVFMTDGDEPQGNITGSPFTFYSTHVQLATDIAAAANNITGITGSIDNSNAQYTYAILTASSSGLAAGFTVETSVTIQENYFDVNANDEQHLLMTLSDKSFTDVGKPYGHDLFGNDIVGNNGTYGHLESQVSGQEGTAYGIRGTKLKIFASSMGTWTEYHGLGSFHPTSGLDGTIEGKTFDWVWNPEVSELPEPFFVNDGNRCAIVDGNFNLPNYNIWYGYVDRSRFFLKQYELQEGDNSLFHFDRLRKWYKWPERKVWSFTEGNFIGHRNPYWCWGGRHFPQEPTGDNTTGGFGVMIDASTEGAGNGGFEAFNQWVDDDGQTQAGYDYLTTAPMQFKFKKWTDDISAAAGTIDWGPGPPAEEDTDEEILAAATQYRFYLAAVYDDGSESLPTHQFTFNRFGDEAATDEQTSNTNQLVNTNLKVKWNEFVSFKFLFRPISRRLMQILESGQQDEMLNNPEIMNEFCFPDPRVVGIRMYYTDSLENHSTYWNMCLMHFEKGIFREGDVLPIGRWGFVAEGAQQELYGISYNGNIHDYIRFKKKPKGDTYEMINGFNPADCETTYLRYKCSTIAGNRMFVGNIEVESKPREFFQDVTLETNFSLPGFKRRYNDRMVMSGPGQYSIFPYPNNVFDLDISDGDEIIALASVGSKVLQFKRGILYIVDISSGIPAQFYVDKRLRHKGVEHKNHVCETSEGVFFFNKYGAWIFDGDEMKNVFVNADEQDKKQQRINPSTWNRFVDSKTMCSFNPITNEVFILRTHTQDTNAETGDCYIYHILADAWTFGKERFHQGHSTGNLELTNFSHVGADFKTSYMSKNLTANATIAKLFSWEESQNSDQFRVVTKTTDLGDSESYKSILGLTINVVQAETDSSYSLAIYWREGPGKEWTTLDNIANAATDSDTRNEVNHSIIFNPPAIKGIKSIQLRIEGLVEGDFGINDINLIFRKYRAEAAAFRATKE